MNDHNDQIKVIGAGFGRTGTNSLKVALDILGYNTYHMKENFKHGHYRFWIKVSNEYHNRKDTNDSITTRFDEIFKLDEKEQYTATCDWPSALYWEEQLKQYPNAKVILTIRDPESWYRSCMNTIFQTVTCSPHCDSLMALLHYVGFPSRYFNEFFKKVVDRDTFHGDWSKENIMKVYQHHISDVVRRCPRDKLLVYEVSQGWAPLCDFLDQPIPDVPFPHVNDTKEFQRMIMAVRFVAIVGIATAVSIPAFLGVWYMNK